MKAILVIALLATALAGCGSSANRPAVRSTGGPATVTRTVTDAPSPTRTTASTSTATATPSTATTSSTTASPAATQQCVAADLALVSLGGSGATGHELLAFGLRNTSGHACRTGAYPGVLFLDAAGRGLPTTPDHTTSDFFGHTTLRALTVAPGGLVSFRLGVTDVGAGGSDRGCVTARGLQVIAPDDTAPLRITRDIDECGGAVTVSPLQAGTGAEG